MSEELFRSFDSTHGIATLTLNRTHAANSLTWELADSLGQAVREESTRAGCIVISANGPTFCSGVDLETLAAFATPSRREELREHVYGSFQSMISAIVTCPVPVIGSLQGPCLGVGADLSLAFDLAIGSTDFWLEETWTKIGATSALGGGHFLTTLLGTRGALDLLLTARRVDAEMALRLGIIQYLVPADELAQRTTELAATIARADRDAVAATKRLVRAADHSALTDYLRRALDEQIELITRPAFRSTIEALQKRLHRRPDVSTTAQGGR